VAAGTEDDAGPMASGRTRGKVAGRRSVDAPGCDTDAVYRLQGHSYRCL
jgi:hypothetical protein